MKKNKGTTSKQLLKSPVVKGIGNAIEQCMRM